MTQLDLLATEPQADTQCKTLLDAFRRGEVLTVSDALHRYGVYALSQRCGDLREMGWNVQGEMIKLPNGKRIAQYKL
jgi:hypothetical protein